MSFSYPRVELHVHLDGAIPDRLFARYSREDGLIPDGVSDAQWVQQHRLSTALSLADALARFDIILGLLNSPARLSECTDELLEDMYEEGIRLAEIRFAPQSHKPYMNIDEATRAVLTGLHKASKRHPDMAAGILLCMMHSTMDNSAENTETVRTAARYLNQGVVGIDLAGNEGGNPLSTYTPQFNLAKELGVPFTIHAGESCPASNVQWAIDMGASRIGHGVNAIFDPAVVSHLVQAGTTLEVCPTSNIFASAFPAMPQHPVRKLFDAGVSININTDDPFLLDIDLEHEYETLRSIFHFTEKELVRTNLDGAKASFCPDKDKIIKQLDGIYHSL